MKKLIPSLLIVLCGFIQPLYSQTQAYTDFVKKADFLKECKQLGGFDNSWKISSSFVFEIVSVKRENGNVVSFTVNYGSDIRGEEIKPNETEAPTYWNFSGTKLVMYKEWIVFLSADPAEDDGFKPVKWFKLAPISAKEEFKMELSKKPSTIIKAEEIKTEYASSIAAKKSAKVVAQANAKAQAEEHKAKYSIKGKKVSKLEIVTKAPANFGVGSKFTLGVVATLADGTVIKTKSLGGEGYLDDYQITVDGKPASNFYAENEVGSWLDPQKGDYVLVEAASVHHPDLKKASTKVTLNYNLPLKFNYNGRGGNVQGDNADNIRVEVKNVKHTETGVTLVEYRIYTSKGLDKIVRLEPSQTLELTANGGNSGSYSANGKNSRGADAGNITLYVDPAVGNNYRFEYSNKGGKGGSDAKYLRGEDGRDGTFTKTVQTIK